MINLTKHRPTNNKWVEEYGERMGWDALVTYQQKVFKALDKLAPGKHYNILKEVRPENQDLFIKSCCSYIQNCPHIVMSDDYSRVEHIKGYYE